MNQIILRRVQMEQLEILKEIKRVCEENNINYFLDSGTLIGAVRHKGFIPWDDDVDIGMLREDYIKFQSVCCKLGKDYYWQSWNNDKSYALPFGKVRKKGTIYIEEKNSLKREEGFYVDVFPFDYAPINDKNKRKLVKKRVFWARCMLMKHNNRPWINHGKTDMKKKVGYIPYWIISKFFTHDVIVEKYESLVMGVQSSGVLYEQIGKTTTHYYLKDWFLPTKKEMFENDYFSIPIGTHERLKEEYGDYMELPPENQRENRHSILKVKFSDGEEYENV